MGLFRKAAEIFRLLKKIDTVNLTPVLKQGARAASEVNDTLARAKKEFDTFQEALKKWGDVRLDFSTPEKTRQSRKATLETGNELKNATGQLARVSQEALNKAEALLDQAIEMDKMLAGTGEAEKAAELVKQARATRDSAYEANRLAQGLNADIKRSADGLVSAANQGERSVRIFNDVTSSLSADRINSNIYSINTQLETATKKSGELSASLNELSQSTGITLGAGIVGVTYSSQLSEHPLQPVVDGAVDGAIKGLEVVDSVACLGGYNPLCAVEDKVYQGATQASSAAGDVAARKINEAFKQAEQFANEGARQFTNQSAWGFGP
jgi:hypothetical protein